MNQLGEAQRNLIDLAARIPTLTSKNNIKIADFQEDPSEVNKNAMNKSVNDLMKAHDEHIKQQSALMKLELEVAVLGTRIKAEPQGGPAIVVEQATAAPPRTGIQGAQLNSIPIFTGEDAQDCEAWVNMVDRCKTQFTWTDSQTAAAIKSKLGGEAGRWLRAKEKRQTEGLNAWSDITNAQTPLKTQIENRFKVTVSLLAASEAITDLKQKPNENVSAFFDRVILALDIKNYHVADKTTVAYKASLESETYTFFSAGMREEYRKSILGGRIDPPATADQLLTAARASELEAGKYKTKVVMETERREVDSMEKMMEKKLEEMKIAFMNKHTQQQKKANKKKGSTPQGGQCFICGDKSHWANKCPKKKRKEGFPSKRTYEATSENVPEEEVWSFPESGN